MQKYFFIIPILILLVIITIQDLRTKMISAFLFPLLFIVLVCENIFLNSLTHFSVNFFLNVLLLSIILISLKVFFALRGKKKLIGELTNWGDIFMFLCLCSAFNFVNFYLFFCGSSILIVIGVIFTNLFKSEKIKSVPQAGLLAAGLFTVKIFGLLNASPLVSEEKIISLLWR